MSAAPGCLEGLARSVGSPVQTNPAADHNTRQEVTIAPRRPLRHNAHGRCARCPTRFGGGPVLHSTGSASAVSRRTQMGVRIVVTGAEPIGLTLRRFKK